MKIRFLFIAALLLFGCGADAARFPRGAASPVFTSQLPIGGGGWLVNIESANDGQYIATTDTYGGWIKPAGGTLWSPLFTQSSMPPSLFGYWNPTTGDRTGTNQINHGTVSGVSTAVPAMICGSSTNSAFIYAVLNGNLLASSDHGATFALTNFANVAYTIFNYRQNGNKCAVDPNNSSHVLVGTDTSGLRRSTDGTNFSTVSGVPSSTADSSGGQFPGYNIAFDPSSAHTCGVSGNLTCIAYAFNYVNTAGTLTGNLYRTADGGITWGAVTGSGGPTSAQRLVVSPSGTVYVASGVDPSSGGTLFSWIGSAWTNQGISGIHAIAADPSVSTRVIAQAPNGQLNVGTSCSPTCTWTGLLTFSRTATDVPWLAWTWEFYMSSGNIAIDPANSKVVFGEGIGVWTTPSNVSSTHVWTSQTANIEQMDAIEVIAPNGVPIIGVQDRGTFKLSPPTYPSTQNVAYQNGVSLSMAADIDWASSNKNFIAAINTPWGGPIGYSGYSTDGGDNWLPFNSMLEDVPGTSVSNVAGQMVLTLQPANAALLTSWTAGSTGSTGSVVRVVGWNGAITTSRFWPITKSGNNITLQGSVINSNINLCSTCTYRVYVDTTPRNDWNGLFGVTATANDGGAVQVTFGNAGAGALALDVGQYFCFSGVGGTTEANGCFTTINPNNSTNTVTLFGTTWGSHAFTSGGAGTRSIQAGGGLAVSTPTNMIIIPGDSSYPQCSTDGINFTEIRVPAGVAAGGDTGWGFNHFFDRQIITADRVTANTFYGYNINQGVYKFTNCGAPTIVSAATLAGGTPAAHANLFPSGGANSVMKSVNGYAGHLFFTAGTLGGATDPHPAATSFYRSIDGGNTWTAITGFNEVVWFDSNGAIGPGSDYPTIYVAGFLNNVYGIYRSTSTAALWATNSQTWTKVGDYPNGSDDLPRGMAADGVIWNKWYMGLAGSSFTYGQQN